MIRHSDDRRILLCLRADVYNAEAPFIHAIAHRIFHKRLQDKRGQDAIQLLLNIKFHSQLFFKAGLLQLEIVHYLIQLCGKAYHVLFIRQGLPIV